MIDGGARFCDCQIVRQTSTPTPSSGELDPMAHVEFCVDARGTRYPKAGSQPRIVSLVPSLTELLCDLGLANNIVGRTGFCIHPRETVKRIPKVGGTKDVNIEKIRALKPTHVLVNIDENTRDIADRLATFVQNIFVTHPLAPGDNVGLFESLGFLFSCEQRAALLVRKFTAALENLRLRNKSRATSILYLIWREPWMTVSPDTYISQMLRLIDWHSLPAKTQQRYPAIELTDYIGKVDKVLLSSEPYPFRDKHLDEVKTTFGPNTDVTLVDGEMLSWYGSRSILGIEYLAKLGNL